MNIPNISLTKYSDFYYNNKMLHIFTGVSELTTWTVYVVGVVVEEQHV